MGTLIPKTLGDSHYILRPFFKKIPLRGKRKNKKEKSSPCGIKFLVKFCQRHSTG